MLKFAQAFVVVGCSALAITAAAQNLKEMLENDKRKAAEQEKRAQADEIARRNQAVRCGTARENLAILKEQRPVYTYDGKGNKKYIEDKDRPGEIALWQREVSDACR
ncbi:MAG: hypothetical protein HY854_13615 [Burkholderiales bacterium]|nr:hypothetical protein [Burkholderiales bacterium]